MIMYGARFYSHWIQCCFGLLVAFAATSQAAVLPIASYSMQNGESGSQTYYDDTYGGPGSSGNPNVSGSFLSGGLGQLTNGLFAAPTDIFDDEWVGWTSIQPTIVIDLGATYFANSVGVHASNWSPPFNDVGAPGSFNRAYSLNGTTFTTLPDYPTTVADRSGDDPRWVDVPFGVTARYVRVQPFDGIKQSGTGAGPPAKPWIFLDEIRVDGVPEPATWTLLTVATIAVLARWRNSALARR